MGSKSARYRARLKAKFRRRRLVKAGYMKKRRPGGRLKMVRRHGRRQLP